MSYLIIFLFVLTFSGSHEKSIGSNPQYGDVLNGLVLEELDGTTYDIQPANVITVPTYCPPGQSFVNGACRDIWRLQPVTQRTFDIKNVITVPTNCPPGYELVNGACREIWRRYAVTEASYVPQNMITAPTNCPPGQQLINGACRDIWRGISKTIDELFEQLLAKLNVQNSPLRLARQTKEELDNAEFDDSLLQEMAQKNIINVPNQCPAGYRPDANGICREIL